MSLIHLPNEILYRIIALLSPLDLSRARDVCQKTRYFCDQPCYWKSLVLDIDQESTKISLWNLKYLKRILDPHRSNIETIHIRGVRDSIMQYLLLECPQLKELAVCGWLTLSDHSFRLPLERKSGTFALRRLKLIGNPQQRSNFISLDSVTLGQWINHCPNLEELSVNCKVHFHAEDLIRSIKAPTALRSIVIATKNTWSSRHVTQLFRHCAQLQFLGLIPDCASLGYMSEKRNPQDLPTLLRAIVSNNRASQDELVLLEKHSLPVAEEEMTAFHNIAIFSDL